MRSKSFENSNITTTDSIRTVMKYSRICNVFFCILYFLLPHNGKINFFTTIGHFNCFCYLNCSHNKMKLKQNSFETVSDFQPRHCQHGNGLRIVNGGSGQWKRLRSRMGHALDDDDDIDISAMSYF